MQFVVSFHLAVIVSLCAAAACSDSSGEPAFANAPPSGSGSGSESEGGTPEADGATDPHASLGDAAAADGGVLPIDPVAVGRSWTYDVKIFGIYPLCEPGNHTGTVLALTTRGGKPAYEIESFCPGLDRTYWNVVGDRIEMYLGGSWRLGLDEPVEDGHTWSNGTNDVSWRAAGTVTVPAGTFEACFDAVQKVGYPVYTTFCRGVGPVRWYTKDLLGNGYDAKLQARNFQ